MRVMSATRYSLRMSCASGCCRKAIFTRGRPVELFQAERARVKKFNPSPYDSARIVTVRASKQFRVTLDTNHYSVPAQYASARVTMKAYPERVCIYHDNQLPATQRSGGRTRHRYFLHRGTQNDRRLCRVDGGSRQVVFAGGIGEHAEAVRERICDGLEFLDVQFEVIETQEERQIARHCRKLLVEKQ
jgi:hypothetical protein